MTDEKLGQGAGAPESKGTSDGGESVVSILGESVSVEWEQLAAGRKTIAIRYKGMTYQLRETRNGKLILTK